MIWDEWKKIYTKILMEFGYSEEKDRQSAILAVKMAKNTIGEEELRKLMEGKIVSVCGAALRPTDMERIKGVIIAADETSSLLLKRKILPHLITTDLDGNVPDIIEANKKGSIVIVHAHGDNASEISKWIPEFPGKIMITTQSFPFKGAYNFGGFTDGDRAYCIARHFGASKIILLGFDFENVIEKKGKNSIIKKKKLKWAKKIIEMC